MQTYGAPGTGAPQRSTIGEHAPPEHSRAVAQRQYGDDPSALHAPPPVGSPSGPVSIAQHGADAPQLAPERHRRAQESAPSAPATQTKEASQQTPPQALSGPQQAPARQD